MPFKTADKIEGRKVLTTGVPPLDVLLGGGLKIGLTHLSYGTNTNRDILHWILVHSPHSTSSIIIIDSGNTINVEKINLRDCPEGDPRTLLLAPTTYPLPLNQLG